MLETCCIFHLLLLYVIHGEREAAQKLCCAVAAMEVQVLPSSGSTLSLQHKVKRECHQRPFKILLLHHSSELPVHHAHQLPQNTAAAWHMALPMVQQLEAKTKLRDNCGDELYSSVYLLLPVSQLVLFSLECFFVDVLHFLPLSPKLLLMYGNGEADQVLSFSDFIFLELVAAWLVLYTVEFSQLSQLWEFVS
jgi:hypothetical protein